MPHEEFLLTRESAFPDSFEADFYLSHATDVQSKDQALEHFEAIGRTAGFPGSPGTSKKMLLDRVRQLGADAILEIGPGSNPALVGDNVWYFDVKSRDELVQRYQNDPSVQNVPNEIHFVHPEGDLRSIDRQFGVVVSSHVIEHTADLVDHFEAVSSLLLDGGYYVLLAPDKRYCFDHFKEETILEEVIVQNMLDDGGRSRFYKCYLLERMRRAHNSAKQHWDGDHGTIAYEKSKWDEAIASASRAFENPVQRYGYHNWFFTDRSFEAIVAQLHKLGCINLAPLAVYNTVRDSFEFGAVLRKGGAVTG